MNREDIQEEFRQQEQEPTRTPNKCEIGVNPKYVIWLEKRILALSITSVSKSVVCDYCDGWGYTVDENGRRKDHCKECNYNKV